MLSIAQWFTFDFAGPEPKLVPFVVDVLDRDVPIDVALFVKSRRLHPAQPKCRSARFVERYNTLDQIWSDPGPELRRQARALLGHEQPLVRFSAAAMLGRIADVDSINALDERLGDPSKIVQPLQSNPSVRESLRLLSEDEDSGTRPLASELKDSLQAGGGSGTGSAVRTLDFDYFVKHVEPIFERPAADGDSCAKCHGNHSILHLIASENGQRLSPEQLRANFLAALKVVDLEHAEDSLILIKPRSSFEGIGQPELYRKTHAGDIRWPEGKESEEYKAILHWIEGAKESLTAAESVAGAISPSRRAGPE